ncbi:MAG: helix-turn-helix domain-containing protein [Acidobacteriaceae bacterium]|nr:helix-turn-helix domain-containing protein [Acidobacteriaceae bacterium]
MPVKVKSSWLSVTEVAELLGISRRSVYNRINEGSIEARKFGKQTTRIHEDEVERFVEESERRGRGAPRGTGD